MSSRFTQDFSWLVGQEVREWVGTELAVDQHAMAFASGECLQLLDVALQFQDDTSTRLLAQLDEDGNWFGLYLDADADQLGPWPAEEGDFLRDRVLNELPLGSILAVDCDIDSHGQATAIALRFSGGTVKLSCGEIISEHGSHTVVKPQEFLILEVVGHISPA